MEDLFLTFAKKASAFNSWFENAEEDLTDPVRCNSLEEIRALREAHEAFRSSLSSAQADFNQLAELDQQIKSYQVASNPYTWFTMEALAETWRNLQKIIKVGPRPASSRPRLLEPGASTGSSAPPSTDSLRHPEPFQRLPAAASKWVRLNHTAPAGTSETSTPRGRRTFKRVAVSWTTKL